MSPEFILRSLVVSIPWLPFCKALEANDVEIAIVDAYGLRWQLTRQIDADELVYCFTVRREGNAGGS